MNKIYILLKQLKETDKKIEEEKQRLKENEEKYLQEKVRQAKEKAEADSLIKTQKKDTVITPKNIVDNYKDKTPKKDTAQKTKNNTPSGKTGVALRVQVAISETEPDLKANKYKTIEDAWFYKAGNVFKITSGNFSSAEEVIKHQEKMRQAGYKDAFVVAFKNNQRIDFKEAIKQLNTPQH